MKRLHYFLSLITFLMLIVAIQLFRNDDEEGFAISDIIINTCPLGTQSIQTAKGNTDCCSGDMIDGKCNGKTVCTNSPSHDGIQTCSEYWRKQFQAKQKKFCPKGIPNYYEDVFDAKKEKGCSQSPIQKNGSQPQDLKMKKCVVYSNSRLEKTKADSCFLEKERLNFKCPIVDGQSASPTFYILNNEVVSLRCTYKVEPDNLPYQCFDDSTYSRYVNLYKPSEKNNLEGLRLNHFCSTINKRRAQIRDEKRRREEAERKLRQAQEELKKVRSFFSGMFRKFGIRF